MQQCAERGLTTEGTLPGGLNVRRRAPEMRAKLLRKQAGDPLAPMDWLTLYAIAVNEENAAGGRVVTAPTNGAAGVIPAVAHYYRKFCCRRGRRRDRALLFDGGRDWNSVQGECIHLRRGGGMPGGSGCGLLDGSWRIGGGDGWKQ